MKMVIHQGGEAEATWREGMGGREGGRGRGEGEKEGESGRRSTQPREAEGGML